MTTSENTTTLTIEELTAILCQKPQRITKGLIQPTKKTSGFSRSIVALKSTFRRALDQITDENHFLNSAHQNTIKLPPKTEWKKGSVAQAVKELRAIGMTENAITLNLKAFENVVERSFNESLGKFLRSEDSVSFTKSDAKEGRQYHLGVRYAQGDFKAYTRRGYLKIFEEDVYDKLKKRLEESAELDPTLLQAAKLYKVRPKESAATEEMQAPIA